MILNESVLMKVWHNGLWNNDDYD